MVTCSWIAQTGVGPLGRLASCFLFVTNLKSRFTCYLLIEICNSGKLIGFLPIIATFNLAFENSSFYCVVTGSSLNTSSNRLREIFLNAAHFISNCHWMLCNELYKWIPFTEWSINYFQVYNKLHVFPQTLILKLYYLFQRFRTVLRSAVVQSSNVAEYSGKFITFTSILLLLNCTWYDSPF